MSALKTAAVVTLGVVLLASAKPDLGSEPEGDPAPATPVVAVDHRPRPNPAEFDPEDLNYDYGPGDYVAVCDETGVANYWPDADEAYRLAFETCTSGDNPAEILGDELERRGHPGWGAVTPGRDTATAN